MCVWGGGEVSRRLHSAGLVLGVEGLWLYKADVGLGLRVSGFRVV